MKWNIYIYMRKTALKVSNATTKSKQWQKLLASGIQAAKKKRQREHKKMLSSGFLHAGCAYTDTAGFLITDPAAVIQKPPQHSKKIPNAIRTAKGHGHQLNGQVLVFSSSDGEAHVYVKPLASGGIKEARIIF